MSEDAYQPGGKSLYEMAAPSDSGAMKRVLEFHRKLGLPVSRGPSSVRYVEVDHPGTARLRSRLQVEETGELNTALFDGEFDAETDNLVRVADALADIVYVAYGTALTYGIDLDAVLAEVHRSNMTKEPGEDGKAVKGPAYSPPDVKRVLRYQRPLW